MEGDLATRVSVVQDTAMVEVGERGQPPGDPPDVGVTWASKVKGNNVGGRLSAEKVLAAEFVRERLNLEFPDGDDGEPVITIGQEVLDAMNGLWKQCMVVKVLGRDVPINVLTRRLKEMWRPKGAMHVLDLPRKFFMVRFELEEEYLEVLTGGPWMIFGSYLMVKAWSPEFDPVKDEIVTTPVWIRLSNIPVNFYHEEILMGIARGLGKPVKVDTTTLNFERGRFARVCVEVDLNKPLKGSVRVNGERYFVAYEGMTNICAGCGMYGHLIHACPKKPLEENVIACVPSNNGFVEGERRQSQDDFTEVRRGGRRTGPVQRQANLVAGRVVKESGRSLREIPQKDFGNIEISNKFGGLVVADNDLIAREENIRSQSNKENEISRFNAQKEVGLSKGRVESNGPSMGKGKGVQKIGPIVKKAQQVKSSVSVQRVRQNRGNKNGQGLVFGSSSEEMALSGSGKRLRVESGNAGRLGGAYSARGSDRVEKEEGMNMNVSDDTGEKSNLESDGRLVRTEAEMVDVSPIRETDSSGK